MLVENSTQQESEFMTLLTSITVWCERLFSLFWIVHDPAPALTKLREENYALLVWFERIHLWKFPIFLFHCLFISHLLPFYISCLMAYICGYPLHSINHLRFSVEIHFYRLFSCFKQPYRKSPSQSNFKFFSRRPAIFSISLIGKHKQSICYTFLLFIK